MELDLCDVIVIADGVRFSTRQDGAVHRFVMLNDDLRAVDAVHGDAPFDAQASLGRCWPRIRRAAQELIDAGVSGEPLIVTSTLVEQASPTNDRPAENR